MAAATATGAAGAEEASKRTPERPAEGGRLFFGRGPRGHRAGRTSIRGGACGGRRGRGISGSGGPAARACRAVHERLGRRRGVRPHVRRRYGRRGRRERSGCAQRRQAVRRAVRYGGRGDAPHGAGRRRVVVRVLCGHWGGDGRRRGLARGRRGHGLWRVLRPVDGEGGPRRVVCRRRRGGRGARRGRRRNGRRGGAAWRVLGARGRRAFEQRGEAGAARKQQRRRGGAAGPDRNQPRCVARRAALLAQRLGGCRVREGRRGRARRARVRRDSKRGHVARQGEVPRRRRGVRDDQGRAAQPGSDGQGRVDVLD